MDLYCNNDCGQLLVRGNQIIFDAAGIPDGLVPIPPLDTVVLGNESSIMLFGPMMETDLLCARCGFLVGALYYHRQVLGTSDNDDPEYLFKVGFERVLYLLCTKGNSSQNRIEDDTLVLLIGGLDISQNQIEEDVFEPLIGGVTKVSIPDSQA